MLRAVIGVTIKLRLPLPAELGDVSRPAHRQPLNRHCIKHGKNQINEVVFAYQNRRHCQRAPINP